VDSKESEVQGPRDGVGQSQAGSTALCGIALYSTVQCRVQYSIGAEESIRRRV
jgi:hypothetical protein